MSEFEDANDEKVKFPPRRCYCCEKSTTGYFSFVECGTIKLTVCMECLAAGMRWIVRQAREAEDAAKAITGEGR